MEAKQSLGWRLLGALIFLFCGAPFLLFFALYSLNQMKFHPLLLLSLFLGLAFLLAGIAILSYQKTIAIDRLMGTIVFSSHIFWYPLRRTFSFSDIQGVELKETERGLFATEWEEGGTKYRYYEINLLTYKGKIYIDGTSREEEAKELAERIGYLLGREVRRTVEGRQED